MGIRDDKRKGWPPVGHSLAWIQVETHQEYWRRTNGQQERRKPLRKNQETFSQRKLGHTKEKKSLMFCTRNKEKEKASPEDGYGVCGHDSVWGEASKFKEVPHCTFSPFSTFTPTEMRNRFRAHRWLFLVRPRTCSASGAGDRPVGSREGRVLTQAGGLGVRGVSMWVLHTLCERPRLDQASKPSPARLLLLPSGGACGEPRPGDEGSESGWHHPGNAVIGSPPVPRPQLPERGQITHTRQW